MMTARVIYADGRELLRETREVYLSEKLDGGHPMLTIYGATELLPNLYIQALNDGSRGALVKVMNERGMVIMEYGIGFAGSSG